LVLAGCLLTSLTGCGGGGISAADTLKADHRLGLIPIAAADVEKVERVGDWTGNDNILIGWLKVTLKEGTPYVTCISVDIAGPVTNEHDLSLVVTDAPESACKGVKPRP